MSSLREFAMLERGFPSLCDTASCVRRKFAMRYAMPLASSMGLRSARWMFSISPFAAAEESLALCTHATIFFMPSILHARSLRSPASSS